jgi:azurin
MRKLTILMGVFLAAGLSGPAALADDCRIVVESDDRMQFDTDTIIIDRDCDKIELELVHTGELGVDQMGHNIVFTRKDDLEALAQDAMQARDTSYVPAGDERVIAASGLVGGGESTTLMLDPAEFSEDGEYRFFCSFPGHWGNMQGRVEFNR